MPRQLPGAPDGYNPLIYMGSEPNLVTMNRRPTVLDLEYELGFWWIIPKTSDGSVPEQEVWVLVGKLSNIATWKRLHGGGGPTNILIVGSQVISTTGSGTYTPTNGMKQVYIECIGAGAGAFAANNTGGFFNPIGGGGGAYTARLYTSDEIGVSQPYFVGSGGAGTAYGTPPPGHDGENTTFGAGGTLMTAGGGVSAVVTYHEVLNGYNYHSPGGIATGGSVNIDGQAGQWAAVINAGGTTPFGNIAIGGSSIYGFGGYCAANDGAFGGFATAGGLYGGGGAVLTASTGTSGAQGMIKVTEYFA